MTAMEFGDRLRVAFAGFGPDQNAFLEMRFKLTL
jgi:hypothetical protein